MKRPKIEKTEENWGTLGYYDQHKISFHKYYSLQIIFQQILFNLYESGQVNVLLSASFKHQKITLNVQVAAQIFVKSHLFKTMKNSQGMYIYDGLWPATASSRATK